MTETHFPIPHRELLSLALGAIKAQNLDVVNAAHALSHDDARYFGLFEVAPTGPARAALTGGDGASHSDGMVARPDYGTIVGIRNSHDQTFPAGLVIGSQVFVCDNLAFSGEVNMRRKHTRHILKDLPGLVDAAMGRLMGLRNRQEHRISAYKEAGMEDRDAHDLIIRAMQGGVIPNARIKDVVNQWHKPEHEEFAPRTAWSLFNGFTQVLRGRGHIGEQPRFTQALHGIMDAQCGLEALPAEEKVADGAIVVQGGDR
jgi:hypothetical protein